MPPKSRSEDDESVDRQSKSAYDRAIDWLFNQSATVVLLFVIIAMLAYLSRYMLTVAIPNHIEQLGKIVKELESSHREERETRDKKFMEDHERDRQLIREFIFNGKKVGLEN